MFNAQILLTLHMLPNLIFPIKQEVQNTMGTVEKLRAAQILNGLNYGITNEINTLQSLKCYCYQKNGI